MNQTQTKAERRKSEETFRKDILTILSAQKRVIGALAQQVTLLQEAVDQLKAEDHPLSEIRALLTASRDAHRRFQVASGAIDPKGVVSRSPDDASAAIAIREALQARLEADLADPTHVDGAWSEDQSAMRGISSASLVTFYRDYLSS